MKLTPKPPNKLSLRYIEYSGKISLYLGLQKQKNQQYLVKKSVRMSTKEQQGKVLNHLLLI